MNRQAQSRLPVLILPVVLLICLAVVSFWEIMANRSRRPFRSFDLVAANFGDFRPQLDGWSIERASI